MLCTNANDLHDSSLCLFVESAVEEVSFEVTLAGIIEDVFNVGITAQQNHIRGLQQKEVVILLLQLTRSLAKFYAKREIMQRARPHETSAETFCDISKHP